MAEIDKLEAYEKSKEHSAAMRSFFKAGWGKAAAPKEEKEPREDVVRPLSIPAVTEEIELQLDGGCQELIVV